MVEVRTDSWQRRPSWRTAAAAGIRCVRQVMDGSSSNSSSVVVATTTTTTSLPPSAVAVVSVGRTLGGQGEPDMKGWLFKWTNYLKGYQRRWFVLQYGLLSYYRNQAEMTHTCRGSISLHGAIIYTVDACSFVVSNGGTQTFHIRAASEVERQCWVTALELAKAKAIRTMESEDDDDEQDSASGSPEEWSSVVRELQGKLQDLQTCSDLIQKHGNALQRALGELESCAEQSSVIAATAADDVRSKAVGERATLFRIASNAMINACTEYLSVAQAHGHKWPRLLQHEREQRQRLQEMVETLAQQHSKLEQAACANVKNRTAKQRPAPDALAVEVYAAGGEDVEVAVQLVHSAPRSSTSVVLVVTHSSGVVDHSNAQHPLIRTSPARASLKAPKNASSAAAESDKHVTIATPHVTSRSSDTVFEGHVSAASEEDEEDNEFYDAVADGGSGSQDRFTLSIPTSGGGGPSGGGPSNVVTLRHSSDSSSEPEEHQPHETQEVLVRTTVHPSKEQAQTSRSPPQQQQQLQQASDLGRVRRTRVPDKPNYPLNLWSIMKNCIGKDLSKIPMPVNFSEPLSMLQRLAEDYEYASLLDTAAAADDVYEQLAYVAAFTISSYSTTAERAAKPFNPLLGETFECDRSDDLGWRLVSEQVSHHPPVVAQHCAGRAWSCTQEFTMTSKFRGKYLQVVPLGSATVEFADGNRYSWRKVTTTVHNIIVGKLWVDQHGDMEIAGKGPAAGIKCVLKYVPYSYFSKESQRRVKGAVLDAQDRAQWIINGTWDGSVEIAPVLHQERSNDALPGSKSTTTVYDTGPAKIAWQRVPPPKDADKYYHFTVFAAQLNEEEANVAPTDSRRRPDQRLMENQEWDKANAEKVRLEEKQRMVRRRRERDAEEAARAGRPFTPYEPVWFKQAQDENLVHEYKNTYWEAKERQDWTQCPDIF